MTGATAGAAGPVAIIGIGCRFPGGVSDPETFWRLLIEGRDVVGDIPSDRIDLGRYFDPAPRTRGKMSTRWGGYLERIDTFDADFFGLSPREAELLDPQQRLLLETAWEAIEDGGLDIAKLDGSRTGVFVGQWLSDFEGRLAQDPEAFEFITTTGSGRYAASGRLSYLFGFRGPSLTIDTACSSSLAAVHLAARSIQTGDSVLALAGGVNVILQPHISIAYSQSGMMAADGRCKFGDAAGDGYVRSEGAGVVLLKPLDRAVADGDRIYAVIRGGAINNDGHSGISMGTPSPLGQEELLRAAYDDAGVPPSAVSYVEAHGTGTRAGDPVEIGAIGAVLGPGRMPGRPVRVGSVKTNFGHTEGAAGVAGLIKATLSLYHGTIPPSLNCRQPTPAIPWDSLPCIVARSAAAWPEGERLAGVSAFGIAGTNAHIVLAGAPPVAEPTEAGAMGAAVLPLSTRSPEALRALALRYADRLSGPEAAALHDLCWSAGTRRSALEHRAVFVAEDSAAMVDLLRRFAAGEATAAAEGRVRPGTAPKLACIVPGQGAQWTGMARELIRDNAAFRTALEDCDRAARPFIDWSIIEQIHAEPGAPAYAMDRIDVIQPVLVALALAYAAVLRGWGIEPDATVGHSMGEVGAAGIARVLDLGRTMQIICRRSALMRRMSGQGAMALVDLSMAEARARIAGRESELAVAAGNSPRSSVLSGDPEAMRQVLAGLERDGIFCRLVKVDVASHSPQMEGPARDLRAELEGMRPASGHRSVYSTVLGRAASGETFDAAYWARNLREPVLFADAVTALWADGVTSFVELGPHPVLLPSVQQTAPEATVLGCGRREQPEQATLLGVVGGLWTAGHAIDWRKVMPDGGRRVALPVYPWQREHHWVDAAELHAGAVPGASRRAGRPDEESREWLYRLVWTVRPLAAKGSAAVEGTLLLAADAGEAGDALETAFRAEGVSVLRAPLADLEAAVRRLSGEASQRAIAIVVLAEDGPSAPFLPLRALKAHLAASWQQAPRLWLITRGAQAVSADEAVAADQTALWGAGRVVAEEHPALWGGLVDLPLAGAAEAAAAVRHILAGDGEDQVALRGGERHVLRLERAETDRTDRSPPVAWRADGSYLITGGLGDVSLHIARAMVADGARRLVLVGRSGLPPRTAWRSVDPASRDGRRIAAVLGLEAAGASVHLASVDIADEAAVRSFLEGYAAEGWPPIRGVVHAAGSFRNELAHVMDADAFDAVVGPKLRGAQILDRLLPDLDLFVLFSSTGGFLSQAGQANYGAANAGLDGIAQARRARGAHALSIAWGVWRGAGLVRDEAGAVNVAEMARRGLGSFEPEKAAALFSWLAARPGAGIVVAPIEWGAYAQAKAGRSQALFADLAAGAAQAVGAEAGPRDFAAMDPAERRAALEAAIRESAGRVLRLPPARLDPRRPLGNMGLTSLMAMEFRNRLEAVLNRPLPATLAWNYPTILALVDHLAGENPPQPAPTVETAAQTADALAGALAETGAMSDEEAMLALRSRSARGRRR